MRWHYYLANKNVFNERLKDSSLHVGSRWSADSEFQVVGGQHGKGVDGLFEKMSFPTAFEGVESV